MAYSNTEQAHGKSGHTTWSSSYQDRLHNKGNFAKMFVKSVLMIDCDLHCVRTTLYDEHTKVWLTVHFLLLDLLHGTRYQLNFVAHPLTVRFVAVLKHFYFIF